MNCNCNFNFNFNCEQVADVTRAMAQGSDADWRGLLPTLDLLLQGSLGAHTHGKYTH
jgi:hypothetical protein